MSDTTRIESLETQVRILKRMLFGVFGVVIVGGLLAATTLQSVPDVIQAKEFQVVDNQGNVFVRVGSMKEGASQYGFIKTLNDEGNSLIRLEGGPVAGMIQTQDGRGQPLVRIGAGENKNATYGSVTTMSSSGSDLVQLSSSTGDDGLVNINNAQGGRIVYLGADIGGNGTIVTENGKKDGVLVALSSTENDEGVVVTMNDKGVKLVRIANSEDGGGHIKTRDSKGQVTSTTP